LFSGSISSDVISSQKTDADGAGEHWLHSERIDQRSTLGDDGVGVWNLDYPGAESFCHLALHERDQGTTADQEDEPAGSRTLEQVEREHILRVLRETGGVVSEAATRLGMPRTTLNAMMRKLGISRKEL
jgi:transcriptional regulator with GAF, ATPase, and Fis domain